MPKRISETKITCKACGGVSYYGKKEELENASNALYNCGSNLEEAGKAGMCCGGCFPALFIPESKERKIVDYNKCPKCGSRAIQKEKITHEV